LSWLRRLRDTIAGARGERALDDEMRFHLDARIDEYVEGGMSRDEARREALRRFGSVTLAKERARDADTLRWLGDVGQDLRYGLRTLRRNPGFTVVAVFTLALGIGANSAIFSIVNAVILQPPPYKNPDQLVRIIERVPATETAAGIPLRVPALRPSDVDALTQHSQMLSAIALYNTNSVTVTVSSEVAVMERAEVSPSLFSVLQVEPLVGRSLRTSDSASGSPKVAVLSYGAWQTYFGRGASVLERTLMVDGQPHAVVGVMPQGFGFPTSSTLVWTPLTPGTQGPGMRTLPAICRLRPATSVEAAVSEVNGILDTARRLTPDAARPARFTVSRIQEERAAAFRPALRVLMVAVGLVLLIACGNVANLLLARAAVREHEIAVRIALGAGRGRLIRQVLTESLVLALAGGIGGLALALVGTRLLTAAWPENINARYLVGPAQSGSGTLDTISLDWSVVLFTIAISIGTGLLFGLVPALRVSRTGHFAAITERTGSTSLGRSIGARVSARGALIIAEIALATLLLVSAGLLIHSFIKLSNVNPGFNPEEVLTFQVVAPNNVSPRLFLNEALVERLTSLEGIEAAGYAQQLPLQIGETSLPFRVVGQAGASPSQEARALPVSYDYLRAIGVPLVAGRLLTERDGAGNAPVMVINEALAQQYFGEGAVGKSVASVGTTPWTIVGIVADIHQGGLDSRPEPEFYVDFRQLSAVTGSPATPATGTTGNAGGSPVLRQLLRSASFAVRTKHPMSLIPQVQSVVRQLDPNASVSSVEPLDVRLSNSVARPRFYASVLGLLSGVAGTLAAIGIYGLIAYSVSQRTREIGIRVALGAEPADVLVLILREGFLLVVLGSFIGIGGAVALTRYLSGLLFGLGPLDPVTFVVVFVAFVAMTMLASYIPARRAMSVNPLVALRAE
jgi:putative ABC transport system permease protein